MDNHLGRMVPRKERDVDNFGQIDQQLTAWIDAHREEIVEATQGLLRIPSLKGQATDNAPFGVETRRALDYALEVAAKHGLTGKNVDGYAAHAEWVAPGVAPDAEIVGVLAHVDVVPEGDGWTHPPYGAEIADGLIYARGASDDKGPAMAGLFALAAVKETGVPLARRIRLILGADEESGFGCVKYYFEHEEMPALGFTPDAMFPLVHAEKGIATAILTAPAPPEGGRLHLTYLSGGRRSNMVPDSAEAIIEDSDSPWEAILARLKGVVGITAERLDAHKIKVTAKGVSAHGSTPQMGVNAVVVLCDAILLLDHQEDQVRLIQQVQKWGQDTTGGTLGVAGSDDVAGPLTANLGVALLENGTFTLTVNMRYPVTWTEAEMKAKLEQGIANTPFALTEWHHQAPLHVPVDDPLIQALLEVYRAETGDQTAPMTMGGGTYARAMTKGVAFGAAFPYPPGVATWHGAHEVDEAWPVEDLIRSTKIFAKALARLGNQ